MISDTLTLKTNGTAGVNALADALERAGNAQARLERMGGSGGLGPGRGRADPSARISEIDARASAKFQLDRQSTVNKLAIERAKQQGAAEKGALRLKEKQIGLEKQHTALVARRERESGLRERAAMRGRSLGGKASGAGPGRAQNALESALGGGGMKGVLEALGASSIASSLISAGATLGAAAGAAGAVIATKFGEAVIEAQAFREDVSRGLETILKSKSEADRVLQKAGETADFLGKSRADVAGQYLDLLAKGFDPQRVDEITRRLADLATVDPRANLAGLSRAIGQIAGKGRLQGDEILQLAEAGLETGHVYAALARNMGKTVPEIIKLQTAGKISAKEGIQGILDAIAGQTGNQDAGLAARKKSLEDITGLINRVKSIPGDILFDLQVGPGLDKTKDALREIIAFFDAGSDTGKETRAVLADTFNALAEGFFGVDTSGGVTETLTQFVALIKDNREEIKQFASDVRGMVGAFASAVPIMAEVAGAFYNVFIGIPYDIGYALGGIPDMLYEVGSNMINALAGGVTGAGQAIIDAITETVGGAITWAKQLLGIASPSKVFMEIGAYTSQGFAHGVASNDNAIQRAASAMAGSAVQGASGAAFPVPGGPGSAAVAPIASGAASGTVVQITVGEIRVYSPKDEADAEEMGRAAARGFRSEIDGQIASAFRRVA